MPPDRLGRDDVAHALDALASNAPAPSADASSLVARGRRRVRQRRVRLVGGGAFALAAVIATVGVVTRPGQTRAVSTTPNAVSTPTLPFARRTSQIAVASATEAWTCVDPLQYTTDGGRSWRDVALPATVPAGRVGDCVAIAGGDLWATWSDIANGTSSVLRVRDFTDVHVFEFPKLASGDALQPPTFVDADHGWVGVYSTGRSYRFVGLYRTVDGGATWTLANDKERFVANMVFTTASRGWAFATRGSSLPPTLLETSDGGVSWSPVDLPKPKTKPGHEESIFRIAAHGDSIVVWGGVFISDARYRTLFDVSTDDGRTWAERAGPAGFEIPNAGDNTFDAADGIHWAVTSGRELRVTDDGGRSWLTRPDMPVVNAAYSFRLPSPTVAWVTDLSDTMLRSSDAGQSWTNLSGSRLPATVTTTTTTPAAAAAPVPIPLALAAPREGWLCSDPALYTDDGGANFTNVDIPNGARTPNFDPLCAAVAGDAWVVVPSANPRVPNIVRLQNGGRTKQTLPFARLAPGTRIGELTFANANDGWAINWPNQGGSVGLDLFHTTNGGQSWEIIDHRPPAEIHFINATDGWGAGTGNDLERTADGGRTWQAVPVPAPFVGTGAGKYVNAVVLTSSGAIVATGGQQTGSLTVPFFDVSTDGGTTWVTRSGPPGIDFGATVPSTFGAIDGDRWQFAYSNDLFVTADGGRTWAEVAQFAGYQSISSVAFLTPEVGFVSATGDPPYDASTVVLETTDGGSTWVDMDQHTPPLSPNATAVNWPGGIIGCPTRPLTPVPAGNPPAGLEQAALDYVHTVRHWPDGAVTEVYRVGTRTKQTYAGIFGFHVASCGPDVVRTSWVVELYSQDLAPEGNVSQAQVAFAHYADGWHAFGHYH